MSLRISLLVITLVVTLVAGAFALIRNANATPPPQSALTLVGPVRVSYDDVDLDTTGVELFSPTVGTIIYSAWYMVETPWRCEVDGEFCGDPQLFLHSDGTDRDLWRAGVGEGNYLLGDDPPLAAGNDDRLRLFGQGGANLINVIRSGGQGDNDGAQLPAEVTAATAIRVTVTQSDMAGPPAQGAADFYLVVAAP